jgi:hypothetical protein
VRSRKGSFVLAFRLRGYEPEVEWSHFAIGRLRGLLERLAFCTNGEGVNARAFPKSGRRHYGEVPDTHFGCPKSGALGQLNKLLEALRRFRSRSLHDQDHRLCRHCKDGGSAHVKLVVLLSRTISRDPMGHFDRTRQK